LPSVFLDLDRQSVPFLLGGLDLLVQLVMHRLDPLELPGHGVLFLYGCRELLAKVDLIGLDPRELLEHGVPFLSCGVPVLVGGIELLVEFPLVLARGIELCLEVSDGAGGLGDDLLEVRGVRVRGWRVRRGPV